MQMLPVCSYLTLLDRYILASFFLLGLNALENFVACWLPDGGDAPLDAPLGSTRFFERCFFGGVCALWLLGHLLIAYGARVHLFVESVEAVREREGEAAEQEMAASFKEQRRRSSRVSRAQSASTREDAAPGCGAAAVSGYM